MESLSAERAGCFPRRPYQRRWAGIYEPASGEPGRPAHLPAGPVHFQGDPVPVPRVRARRAGLHPYRTG